MLRRHVEEERERGLIVEIDGIRYLLIKVLRQAAKHRIQTLMSASSRLSFSSRFDLFFFFPFFFFSNF